MRSVEWIVYDPARDRVKYVWAENQREAIRKGIRKYGLVPGKSDHVSPRSAALNIMGADEFDSFMDSLKGGS